MALPAVVPAPASIALPGGAAFPLTAHTEIAGDADAAATARALIATRTGLDLRAGSTGSGPVTSGSTGSDPAITLRIDGAGTPESYRLHASAASVTVIGSDAAGLFYGIQTLGQLIAETDGGGWGIPAAEIADAPRFRYRGVMLDVARHFHGVETVKALIDRAASLKLNALHLHLSDDQGWRLELRSRPLLTEKASATAVGGDPGGFYTQADYRGIVAYAAAHHMIVVPEFDMPGHTHAVTLAYPELNEQPKVDEHMLEIIRDYGGDAPAHGVPYDGMAVGFSSLKIHDDATYAFVTDVFTELAELTPGPYLHLGGDEALGTPPEDFAHFVERASAIVAATGKTPIAWHEAGVVGERLAPGTVGQYWGFRTPTDGMDEKTRGFVAAGGQIILSPADAIYLDMKYDADAALGLVWAGVVSAQQSYAWDPATVIDGIGDDEILGVEAPLWAETARTLSDIDTLAFPRIASAAEAGWSPAAGASALRTWDSFAQRVAGLAPLWTSMGIAFTPLPGIPWPAAAPAPAPGIDAATDAEATGAVPA
ncbi:MAG: family 20 glycosylhydrolase [Microbacterium sp.]|nr:family 20 glycosylhydrolase [Microbacterium sp.]